jgi:hypothetical protein
MRTRTGSCLAALAALLAGACAATTFQSVWKAPDAKPLALAPGDKIVAMVISDQMSLRRSGEANLADVLDARGFKAVPAYMLIPDDEIRDEAKARARIEASDAVAVVVFRPLGAEQETTTTTTGGYWGAPYYGGFWGGGYYGRGWGTVYASPPVTTTRTDVHVSVETLIYDLRSNKLVWAGRSKTTNPEDVEQFVGELARAVGAELRSEGLVGDR